MDVLKTCKTAPRIGSLVLGTALLAACQAPYLIKSAWSQASLLNSRQSLRDALESSAVPLADRAKLGLAREAKIFAETELALKKTRNYETYVALDRPYVSYVVSAAPKDRLEHHEWWFPFVGHVPYKGYFNPEDANDEADDLRADGLDVVVRGVAAYSTLGWFRDPILSSMLRYSEYDLVNTIIHETVHATVYIKANADFNERLATFIGTMGADRFFLKRDGESSPSIKTAEAEAQDDRIFSEFISKEISDLKQWYTENSGKSADFTEKRLLQFQKIFDRFNLQVADRLTNSKFRDRLREDLNPVKLNNARLLLWRLYNFDLGDFDRVFQKLGRDPKRFIEFARSLEKTDAPESALKAAATN